MRNSVQKSVLQLIVGLMLGLLTACGARVAPGLETIIPSIHDQTGAGHDEHAAHRAMMSSSGYTKSTHHYPLPDINLVDMNGTEQKVQDIFQSDRPVFLNFIFTTCPTICPVMSATFSALQRRLGTHIDAVDMVSISIDPEHDTPERLRAYAVKHRAQAGWRFYTGKMNNVVRVQRAFDVYRGTKMNHIPVAFMRPAGSRKWVRLAGFPRAAELVDEFHEGIAK